MCGIAGIHRLTDRPFPLDRMATALLEGIESRGFDATGFASISDKGEVVLDKAPTYATVFNTFRKPVAESARTVLLHTRFATQGHQMVNDNNHPVVTGSIYAVHNGHIWNDFSVFSEIGKTPKAMVDSEAIPAAVSHLGWDKLEKAMSMLDGHFAVALFDKRRPRELALVKGPGSPLCYIRTKHVLVWASTSVALLSAWKKVIGTPPSYSRVHNMLSEGKVLRVSRGTFQTTSFTVKRPKVWVSSSKLPKNDWAYSWAKSDRTPDTCPGCFGIGEHANNCVSDYTFKRALPVVSEIREEPAAEILSMDDNALVQCDDCGDWCHWDNLRIVGWENIYCDVCADFAVKCGVFPTSTPITPDNAHQYFD